MCHCRFIDYKKCTTLVGDADSGGGYAFVVMGIWEIYIPSSQFFCASETSVSKVYKKFWKIKQKKTKNRVGCFKKANYSS